MNGGGRGVDTRVKRKVVRIVNIYSSKSQEEGG